jgi:hypothetical protein
MLQLLAISGVAMSASSPPILEAVLTPYEEKVVIDQPARFYLFLQRVRFENNQGEFNDDDWQVVSDVSRFFATSQKQTSIAAFRNTSKLVQNVNIETFAQHTADMLIKLNAQIDKLKADLLEQTLIQLSGHGKSLLLAMLYDVADPNETQEIVDWQRIVDEEPLLLYKMYHQVFEQVDQTHDNEFR